MKDLLKCMKPTSEVLTVRWTPQRVVGSGAGAHESDMVNR
jgi:hypothetical protein